ncbi:outer membrane receptor protein involved in Fe transport [Altererythrobacter atlanticus]|uniref:Pesticin receptor n=1 Tax=Croceibacterium atlanticum TaxID=1267766 RepID=A0A0F7KPA3_9SPHN|nr:TonB-dependent receptor [Croceibacterium atlanticum]AKH42353.1 Pesticin receptor precursor [Croceibacterium atlanticum]MBB5731130.1 outer membrane receptor protein involved in Fe transport [Croceibacterium atlanticum]
MPSFEAGYPGIVRGVFLRGVALTALIVPFAVQAQDPAADDMPEIASGNSIIVTATKRETTLQEAPVAVTVASAETLERGQIRDLRDLQTVVPSLSVGQRQSVANTNFFIRGFGNGANNAGIEPSVGVFVDNVYRSRTASQITDLPDVQRIEVLRGPQSTLFGKNASAGVISISTREPQFSFGGGGELTYGNYDQLVAKGYVTGPVNDSIAVSLAGGLNQRDGFFRDGGTGDRTNERDRWFVRGQLLFDPGTDISARIIADYDAIDENCCGVVNLRSGPAAGAVQALGGRLTDPERPFAGTVYNNYNSTNDIENYGISGQFDWDLGDVTLTSITAYRKTDAVTAQDADFTSADLVYPLAQDLRVGTFTQEFRLSATLGDRVDLLLGAFYINENIDQDGGVTFGEDFRDYADLLVQSGSGGALDIATLEAAFGQADGVDYTGRFFVPGTGSDEHYELNSDAISIFGQLDIELAEGLVLTLGGNYTHDSKDFLLHLDSSEEFSRIDLDAPQYASFRGQLLYQGALAQGVGDALALGRAATAAEIQSFAAANMAAFGQIQTGAQAYAGANADNPAANPLASLRSLQLLPPFLDVPNEVEDGSTSDDDFSYTVRLAYDLTPDLNVYASYATGFKASSVNLSRDSRPFLADRDAIIANGLALNNLTYGSRFAGPEESRVIELGVKANFGDFSANFDVFDQEIEGFQSNLFTGTGFALLNAGKQSTFGVEFEGTAQPLPGLTLNVGATYLDPKYDDFQASAVGDLTGTRPAGIPEWTVLLGAQYEMPAGDGQFVPRVSYLWQSDVQLIEGLPGFLVRGPDGSIVDNGPALTAAEPFRREVNDLTASIAYEFDMGLTLSVWGRNLLDDRDIGVIFDSVAQPGGISGYPNDPRTYGVTARYRW